MEDNVKQRDERHKMAMHKLLSFIEVNHDGFIDSKDIQSTFDGMIELHTGDIMGVVIPRFQFTEDGRPIKGISTIMNELMRDGEKSGEAKCSFFLNPVLGDRTPIDILRDGNEEEWELLKREARLFLKQTG